MMRTSSKGTTAAGTLVAALALSSTALAQLPTTGPLSLVARSDIFASCTADKVASQPGRNYPITQIEPNLAINPANPKNFIVGMHQDRWSNGGARGMRGGVSTDAGKTWTPTSTPNVTQCQGGPWPRSSDPWVAFSPDGTAYFSQLTTETLPDPNLFGRSGQIVSQSTDGGLTWGRPTTLIYTKSSNDPKQPQTLHDKNSVFADPKDSNIAYVVWDALTSYTPGFGFEGPGSQLAPAGGDRDGLSITRDLRDAARKRQAIAPTTEAAAAAFPTFVTGPAYMARTINHGRTWEEARIIYDPGSNNQTIGNQIVRLPDGRLADFFSKINDLTGAGQIGYVASDDNGKTWSEPNIILNQTSAGAVTPNKGEAIRSADIIFSVAVDAVKGVTWLTWEDSRFSGVNEVAVSFSQDGYQWFGPTRANQTPRNGANPLFQQGLVPTVVTTKDGTAVITYYDFRNDKLGAATDTTDYWAITCNPFVTDCTLNQSWHKEVKLNLWSFDYNSAPVARGHFLGDYMGLKAVDQTVYPVFGVSEAKDKTTLYQRPIIVPVYNPTSSKTIVSSAK